MRLRGSTTQVIVLAAATLAASACARDVEKPLAGGGGAGAVGPQPSGGGAACGLSSAPVSFALPVVPGAAKGAFGDLTSGAHCSDGRAIEADLRDMNGDRRPDLVLKSACDDTTIGPLAWRVYANTGTGFAAPLRFALPLPRPPECAHVELIDVDGDLRPDLVTTSTCFDAAVGTKRWIVNRNDGSGFESATDFALPNVQVTGAFSSLDSPSWAPACPAGAPAHTTFDVDGDFVPDLVITAACDDAKVGATHWRVHHGNAAGFDAMAADFALPAMPPAFDAVYANPFGATADCKASSSARSYQVGDVDGDFVPDLLVTRLCGDATVGSTRWLVYHGDGTGFAAVPRSLALPTAVANGKPGAFASTYSAAHCEDGVPGYAFVDVDGDFAKDLVVTRACNDTGSGVKHWLVFAQGKDGTLATTGVTFGLPPALGGSPSDPVAFVDRGSCSRSASRPAYFAAYLTEQRFGLVVTRSCSDASVGATRWLLYGAEDCPAAP